MGYEVVHKERILWEGCVIINDAIGETHKVLACDKDEAVVRCLLKEKITEEQADNSEEKIQVVVRPFEMGYPGRGY